MRDIRGEWDEQWCAKDREEVEIVRRRRQNRLADEANSDAQRPLELKAVAELPDEPSPKLSLLRVIVAVTLLAGVGYGVFFGVKTKVTASAVSSRSTWFAPYVDLTLTPTYQFQIPSDDPARQTVIGFVVAASATSCTPSWGSYYSLPRANQSLALSARIAQLRGYGASPVVSFGGQAHTNLAVACSSAQTLAGAYQNVIDTYNLHTIDLDVEGAALNNFAAVQRNAKAVRILEKTAARRHRSLRVWLTLPVEPTGLQDNALAALESMVRDRVQLAGIDVMAMDFTHPPSNGTTMLDLVEGSADSTATQLTRMLSRYGIHVSKTRIWRLLGVTVMIGQNNIGGERFTTADAQGLASFAKTNHLARLSMWSINRDQPCATTFGAELSNTCSGTSESNLEFTHIFNSLSGTIDSSSASSAVVLRPVAPDTNPANAPFPAWNPEAAYVAGYKVVVNGEIYQAKWYTTGQDPSAQYPSDSPWELLGPVLPTDHAPKITYPLGTYPTWSTSTTYVAGERVLYQRLPYQAKWASQGVPPGAEAAQQPSSPWQALYRIPGEPATGG